MTAKFGPAGTAESFKTMGYKKSVQLGEYLEKFGLDHFEYCLLYTSPSPRD